MRALNNESTDCMTVHQIRRHSPFFHRRLQFSEYIDRLDSWFPELNILDDSRRWFDELLGLDKSMKAEKDMMAEDNKTEEVESLRNDCYIEE